MAPTGGSGGARFKKIYGIGVYGPCAVEASVIVPRRLTAILPLRLICAGPISVCQRKTCPFGGPWVPCPGPRRSREVSASAVRGIGRGDGIDQPYDRGAYSANGTEADRGVRFLHHV